MKRLRFEKSVCRLYTYNNTVEIIFLSRIISLSSVDNTHLSKIDAIDIIQTRCILRSRTFFFPSNFNSSKKKLISLLPPFSNFFNLPFPSLLSRINNESTKIGIIEIIESKVGDKVSETREIWRGEIFQIGGDNARSGRFTTVYRLISSVH